MTEMLFINFWINIAGNFLFYAWSFYFFCAHRYDLNVLYRGQHLILQETICALIHSGCSLILINSTITQVDIIISFIFLISHFALAVCYFLLIYRIYILHRLEFGKLHSDEYENISKRLSVWENLKKSLMYTVIASFPGLFIYGYYLKNKTILDYISVYETTGYGFAFAIYYLLIAYLEYFCYLFLFVLILKNKFRLTVKIEICLNLLIWTLYYSTRYIISTAEVYGFLIILRNFSLTLTLIISLTIRSHLNRVPDPTSACFNSMYIYEHKLLYKFIYQFLEHHEANEHLYCLEIGLYINMHKLEKKKHLLKTIQKLCKKIKLPEYNPENEEKIDLYISETLEVIYNERILFL